MKNDLDIPFSLPDPKPAAMLELAIHAIGYILINYKSTLEIWSIVRCKFSCRCDISFTNLLLGLKVLVYFKVIITRLYQSPVYGSIKRNICDCE